MDWLTLLALSISLAMDAVAVAASRGLSAPRITPGHLLTVALWFGGAQGVMPALGALLGRSLGPQVAAYQHIVSAAVLGLIGVKMIHDALRSEGEQPEAGDPFGARTMSMLALATSLDAFAVGVTLPMLGASVLRAALVIGLVTGVLSGLGLVVAHRFGKVLGKRLDVTGGVILLLLGLRVLLRG